MPNLRAIETFIKALEGGSIASAARHLGITPAAASQNISRLERELGSRLLTRTTRSLALTEAGQVYLARVGPVLRQLELAQSDVSQLCGVPQGRLRISCMSSFGRRVLAPLLPEFIAAHPQVQVELLVVDRQVDPLREDVDVGIRYRDALEPGMVVRRIASVPRVLVASPGYLAAHGRPATADDLAAHACLLYRREVDGRFMRWPFLREGADAGPDERIDPVLRVAAVANDIDTLAEMAVHGGGIAWVGRFIADPLVRAGRLEVLDLAPGPPGDLRFGRESLEFFACFRDRQAVPAKVRVFVDFLAQRLQAHPSLQAEPGASDRPPAPPQ
ncbi:MAG: LysR family transcriptional regulator [Xylophilus ampelinus]